MNTEGIKIHNKEYMNLPDNVQEIILNAEGKALATSADDGLHVVPVSTVKIHEGKILLVDYFMGKTIKNISSNPKVALACWRGLGGYQIKGEVEYITEGEVFDETKAWAEELFPDRQVKGILLITVQEVYDVSATVERPGVKLDLPD